MRMVKLIRSQGGVAGVTSQGMADMMALDGGKYGKGILDSCRIKFIMQMEDQEARLVQNILNPVSYTHLDVYKRQGLNNRPLNTRAVRRRRSIHMGHDAVLFPRRQGGPVPLLPIPPPLSGQAG